MKLIKLLLRTFAITIIPLYAIAMADNCYDTVVDKDWKVYYIDPNNEYNISEDKEKLNNIYWDKIKCNWGKKVYSSEEYTNKILENLHNSAQSQEKNSSWGNPLIELILSILWVVAMRKIFVKAWKPGINSIIPIYNFYELSDIAWLSWMFSKVLLCGLAWIILYFFIPLLWIILIILCAIYGVMVDFCVARNFWWSTFASILYIIFNPIAILILAFWNDEYYVKWQKEEIKEIAKKVQINEVLGKENIWNNNANNITVRRVNENLNNNIWQGNNSEQEDTVKYIDPTKFA